MHKQKEVIKKIDAKEIFYQYFTFHHNGKWKIIDSWKGKENKMKRK